jgi:hypothetical protein
MVVRRRGTRQASRREADAVDDPVDAGAGAVGAVAAAPAATGAADADPAATGARAAAPGPAMPLVLLPLTLLLQRPPVMLTQHTIFICLPLSF